MMGNKKFMVRILRNADKDYADVVVEAEDKSSAKELALIIVKANPDIWFDDPDKPQYFVDDESEVEDVTDDGFEQ